jgi:hypothetical protein
MREESVSEAGRRDKDHTVFESDRSSEHGSELAPEMAHDVNRLMTRGNLTLKKLDGTRLREEMEEKDGEKLESCRETTDG